MNNSQKSELVVKDNALINASYNLDLIEQRIILLAILEIRKIGHPEMWMCFDSQIEVYADDYAKTFGTTRQASYIVLKEASKTLFNRQFSYQEIDKNGKKYNVTARWVNRIYYADDMASIKLDFTHYVIPLVTELEKRFTSYELSQVSNITSGYGLRLYELVIAWKNIGKTPMFELHDFRQKLGIADNAYQRMGQFKEKVLDFAVSQINEHTDINLSYEQHKKGRVITGFTFSLKTKKKAVDKIERDPNTIDVFTGQTDNEAKIAPSWQTKGLSDAQIKKIGVNKQEFIDANTSKISPTDRRGYDEIFESWHTQLKDPSKVNSFNKVQELLERTRNA